MTTPGGARRPTARREGKGRTIAPSPGGADSISDEPPVSPDITPLQQAQAGLSRYQLLADNAREILLCLDQAGRVLEANAAAVAAYGYTRAELLGLSLADLLPPDASPTLVEQLAQGAGAGFLFETMHRRRDGTTFPVAVSTRMCDLDGRPVLVSAIQDISARQATERARRLAEERFQLVAELAVDYAFAVRRGPGGEFELEWDTGQLASAPGYNFRAAPTLESWQRLIHPDDLPIMLAHWQRMLAGDTEDFVVRVSGEDGAVHWLQHSGRPRFVDGRLTGFVGAVRDITAQRRAEAALRASEERYRLISELSSDYAFASRIEPDGTVVPEWVTDAFTRITGYQPEAVASADAWRRLIHPDDWPTVEKALVNAMAGETATAEFRIRTAAGEACWLRMRVRGLPGAGRIVGSAQDVTAQKNAERDRRAQTERLAVLRDLSRSILAARAPAEIARAALLHLNALLPAAGWALWVSAPGGQSLTMLAELGVRLGVAPEAADLTQPAGMNGPALLPSPAGPEMRSWLRVPLRAAGETLGLLIAADPAAGRFSARDLELADEVVDEVAIAVQQRRLQEAENQRRVELEAVAEVSAALRQAASGAGVQQALADQFAAVVHAQGSALFLQDDGWVLAAISGQVALPAGQRLAPELAQRLFQRIQEEKTAPAWTEAAPDIAALRAAVMPGLPACALVQLRGADRLPAAMLLGWPAPHTITPPEGQLLAALAEIGSNALQRSNLLETLERRVGERTRELSSLYRIAAVANQALDFTARLEQALEVTLQAVGAESGALYQLTEDSENLDLLTQRGLPAPLLAQMGRLPVTVEITGRVLQTGEPIIVNDLGAGKLLPAEMAQWVGIRLRYIGLPLRSRGRVLGVLGVVGRNDTHLSAEALALLDTIADQLGAMLETERLRRQAERAAVAEERQRLARDLHDSVTQSLYSAVLFATAAQEQMDLGAPERARVFLGRIDAILGQALREMRLLIYELRPAMLEAFGLARALQHRLEAVEGHANVRAHLQIEGDCQLPPALEEALYAVAQEALNNALKHAGAQSVRVVLRGEPARVSLVVEDDGRGFDPATAGARGGAGLGNMRERLARWGGRLQIESHPGQGTRVNAEVQR